MSSSKILNVSDTAFWVATFRADETERKDPLFSDPLARLLSGDKGKQIATSMKNSDYVSWSVVIRTVIIDSYINALVSQGVDTIINLGAGLDTRPYRMRLPSPLRWIEVDFPDLIEFKENLLKSKEPLIPLERIKADLSDPRARASLFSRLNSAGNRILILTEGVVPYLSPEQAGGLAADLRTQNHFQYWILDYFSQQVMRYMEKTGNRQMKNAPFQFNPSNWFEFFERHHWHLKEIRYLGEESGKVGRSVPLPLWLRVLRPLIPKKGLNSFNRYTGYAVLEREDRPN